MADPPSSLRAMRNRYFVCLPGEPPIPWEPPDATGMPRCDCHYFGRAFAAMEEQSDVAGLTFHMTWDLEALPSYGDDVVAVVIGDESCSIPRYFDRVRATYKTHGTRPTLGVDLLRRPTHVNLMSGALYARNCAHYVPGLTAYLGARFAPGRRHRSPKVPPMYAIPVGYCSADELPITPIRERTVDAFFAGSVENEPLPRFSHRRALRSPKTIARRDMVAGAEAARAAHPELDVRLHLTADFQAGMAADHTSYAQALMASKVSLVPRGTGFDTFRFYESIRFGCVVVADGLPPRWYYDGAPIVLVEDWRELGDVLSDLVRDEARLTALHEASLRWWEERCSEAALGRFLARTLDVAQVTEHSPLTN